MTHKCSAYNVLRIMRFELQIDQDKHEYDRTSLVLVESRAFNRA